MTWVCELRNGRDSPSFVPKLFSPDFSAEGSFGSTSTLVLCSRAPFSSLSDG